MIPADLHHWLTQHADALDRGTHGGDELVPRLAAAGLFRAGVPEALGGSGGDVRDGIAAVAAVAELSLTAAFVLWGQRAFIEYLLQSPNDALRRRWLPGLLDGRIAGATGLSNAMKFLSGIESLQVQAQARDGRWTLDGKLPWVTNLAPVGFVTAVAVDGPDGPAIFAVPHDAAGVSRGDDLELISLQGSNTATLAFDAVELDDADLIHASAKAFLPAARPAFLGLQCGMSIGLARRSLAEAARRQGDGRHVLGGETAAVSAWLAQLVESLDDGVIGGDFVRDPVSLFRLRIALAEVAQAAIQLELQSAGGRAYLSGNDSGFARRWNEIAFVPVVTPSLVQLKTELAKRGLEVAA